MYPRNTVETFGYDTTHGTVSSSKLLYILIMISIAFVLQYPVGRLSTLGLLTNPLHRQTVAGKILIEIIAILLRFI